VTGVLGLLAPLLTLFGIETDRAIETLKRHAVVWGVIAVLGIVVVVCLVVAANAALSLAVGPVVAPLIIAVAAALIALIVYLVAAAQDAAAKRREEERRRAAETSALVSSAVIGALPLLLKSPLLRDFGVPAVAAIATALLLRKADRPDDSDKA